MWQCGRHFQQPADFENFQNETLLVFADFTACFMPTISQDLKDIDFPEKLLGDLAGNAFTTPDS